ncbi:ABC transporter substrate-binding protein [Euzebya tangerina]|uniref:ABC transporter substrate-binding protein n=1 Tax=Euzebya tangerina TaxID=591198 RepID=UPI000E30F7DF|nr:sugar ABC transporter substrate-binding protein [Euzebya tangerina]
MSRLKLLAIIALLALIAAACSTDEADDSGDDGSGDDATEEAAAEDDTADEDADAADDDGGEEVEEGDDSGDEASGDGVALRWRTRPDNQAEIDVYSGVSEDIDSAWDAATLEYEPGGSEGSNYQDVLRTELASGTAPDVFWIPGTDVADFAQRGLILNLRDLASGSDAYAGDDAYYEGPMEFLTYDPETAESSEALWGLPRDVSTFALYLNLDLIDEAGVDDPRELAEAGEWNWDTFRATAEAINDLGPEIQGFGMNNWWANPGYFINAAGGSFFTDDRTACAVDSEESIQGLEFMQRLYGDELTVPYGEDAEPPYLAGNVGMFMNGRWATPGTRASASFDWDVVKLPDGPGGPSNWLFWGAYVVNAETEHPEEAFELVTRLTSPEVQTQVAELGANIPSRTDDEETIDQFLTYTPPENNQAFINGLSEDPTAEGPLWEGNWPAFDTALAPEIEAVIAGDRSLDDFSANICDTLDATFES